ncbi:MAG: ISKra4 family transposase, partial [Bryobacteraceae bacterium]|nr:ISKra4 family transposase [Bryobacteraceae bacterium]
TPEELGLNLAEARQILHDVQQSMVTSQVAGYIQGQRQCPKCSVRRAQKGRHKIVFRTLFGKLRLDSMRLHHCDCDPAQPARTFSPLAELLKERTSPELLYLEAKWSSLLSFGVSCDLLGEVLPIGDELNTTTLRNDLHYVAERMEKELGEERESFLPERAPSGAEELPVPPRKPAFTLGLDGAYVHAGGRAGWFEVIVGKSVSAAGDGKYFGFVHNIDKKPKRRLYEVLRSQGLEADQPVQFLSDGEETVRNLQMYISPQSEHWLDWFHITMRLTVMGQMRKGLNGVESVSLAEQAERDLESLKWHLWNGNVEPALRLIDGLKQLLAGDEISAGRRKLLKAIRDFGTYIATNQAFIPDYGDRHRNHETISTAFTESAVNQLVSRRMIKQQQMHWSQRGAHLLLQVRARVLNNELRDIPTLVSGDEGRNGNSHKAGCVICPETPALRLY